MNYINNMGNALYNWWWTEETRQETNITRQEINNLDQLPDELKVKILSYCDFGTISKVSACSRKLRRVCQDNLLWKHYAAKYKIERLDDCINLREQIERRYKCLKCMLISIDSYEKATYQGMFETLQIVLDPEKEIYSEKDFELIFNKILMKREDFLCKTELLLLLPAQHKRLREKLRGLHRNFTTPQQAARFFNIILKSQIEIDFNKFVDGYQSSFIKPLIETHKWKPTREMYDALIMNLEGTVEVNREAFILLKQHGFVPSRQQIEYAVSNYSLAMFKFLLSLNHELKTDKTLLQLAVLHNNCNVTAHLLETITPDLQILKEALRRCLFEYKLSDKLHILRMILQKNFNLDECTPLLFFNLSHTLGRGVLNDFAEKGDFEGYRELLKDVDPEMLTLQILLRKVLVEKNSRALDMIDLFFQALMKDKVRNAEEAIKWFDISNDDVRHYQNVLISRRMHKSR